MKIKTEAVGKIDASDPPELIEALLDLYDAPRIAEEDGDIVPDRDTLIRAERILRAMYRTDPRPYSVYPMPDGDIAIDAHSPQGSKVVMMCDPNGGVRCLAYINGEFHSREYDDPGVIPDSFVRDALQKTQIASTKYAL